MLEIRTLGGLSLEVDRRELKGIGSHKAEAILVYLAVEGRCVNRSVLAALFWPESSEVHAHTALRVALSALRKNLGAYLEITRQVAALRKDAAIYLDLTDLQTKLAGGQVTQALELYHGDFLQGFQIHACPEFEDWLRQVQERTRNSLTRSLHAAIQQSIDHRSYPTGLEYVKRLLELDPLNERAHQQCMLLLALDDQRSAALAQYEQCRIILSTELETAPSPETQQLYQQILHAEAASDLAPTLPVHNLPAPQTSFVGREEELAHIGELIHNPSCRLLTLMGPGGSGKTRLALQASARFLRSFPDGTWFVPLESIPSPAYIVPAIAQALKFEIDTIASQLDPKIQLLDYLRDQSLLIVLDGFEHLVGSAELLSEMLAHAPQLQLLVTSRQKLDLQGEWIYAVNGLPVPAEAHDAGLYEASSIKLFTERARQANKDFQTGDGNYEHVLRICQLVEGMPLGIELAAAWTALLSPGEIATEMEKSLDFLSASTRDISEKHRSLRAAFDSSWMLLAERQREIFSTLSIFNGSFDRHAAQQIAGASVSQLSVLLEKSLLRQDEDGRLTMHALLRQYAKEKLDQSVAARDGLQERHCDYYIAMLREREADFMGPRMLAARDEMRQEMGNVRNAVEWACLHWEDEQIRKLLVTLLCFYTVQGWHEGMHTFADMARLRRDALLARGISDASTDKAIMSANIQRAFLLTNLGQIDESDALSNACLHPLAEAGMVSELSECLHNLGVNASFRGQYERAMELLEEAIRLGRDSNHIIWPTYLLWLGHVYFLLGEYEQGLMSLNKCYELFEKQGNSWGSAFALSKMALAADGLGEHQQAMHYNRQALAIFERAGNQAGKGYSLSRMSMSACLLEDYDQAMQLGQEGFQIFAELGHRWGMCASLCRLGFASLGLGEIASGREFFLDALQQSRNDHMLPLSLYALIGLACVQSCEGDGERALELYRYVQRHPQTPTPYLQMAARWMGEEAQIRQQEQVSRISAEETLEPIDQIIERLLH